MAKSFTFSLQKIFDFRKSIEEKKAIELSDAQYELKNKQEKLSRLTDRKEEFISNEGRQNKNSEKLNINNLKIQKDYILQLNENIENQIKEVNESNVEVEKKREKLLSATRDKKILEKLKHKYFENYRKMKNIEDVKKEDEVAGRIALNKRKKELN